MGKNEICSVATVSSVAVGQLNPAIQRPRGWTWLIIVACTVTKGFKSTDPEGLLASDAHIGSHDCLGALEALRML